jgi:hypothetical protein
VKTLIVLTIAMNLFAATVKADSNQLDTERLNECGGQVELRESSNGDLSLKFENLYEGVCNKVTFYDYSSKKQIKSYSNIELSGQTYTLSKSQRESLSNDCQLGVSVEGVMGHSFFERTRQDQFKVVVPSCLRSHGWHSGKTQGNRRVSYEWSSKHNCKKMINGEYSGKNVADSYCR